MTMYLLDTNVLSHLIRNPQGVVANRIASVGEDAVCTSVIVAAELRYGCAKKVSRLFLETLEQTGRAQSQSLATLTHTGCSTRSSSPGVRLTR